MIVEKIWTTVDKVKPEDRYYGIYFKVLSGWRGWYLFGIIPLYIRQESTKHI